MKQNPDHNVRAFEDLWRLLEGEMLPNYPIVSPGDIFGQYEKIERLITLFEKTRRPYDSSETRILPDDPGLDTRLIQGTLAGLDEFFEERAGQDMPSCLQALRSLLLDLSDELEARDRTDTLSPALWNLRKRKSSTVHLDWIREEDGICLRWEDQEAMRPAWIMILNLDTEGLIKPIWMSHLKPYFRGEEGLDAGWAPSGRQVRIASPEAFAGAKGGRERFLAMGVLRPPSNSSGPRNLLDALKRLCELWCRCTESNDLRDFPPPWRRARLRLFARDCLAYLNFMEPSQLASAGLEMA